MATNTAAAVLISCIRPLAGSWALAKVWKGQALRGLPGEEPRPRPCWLQPPCELMIGYALRYLGADLTAAVSLFNPRELYAADWNQEPPGQAV